MLTERVRAALGVDPAIAREILDLTRALDWAEGVILRLQRIGLRDTGLAERLGAAIASTIDGTDVSCHRCDGLVDPHDWLGTIDAPGHAFTCDGHRLPTVDRCTSETEC